MTDRPGLPSQVPNNSFNSCHTALSHHSFTESKLAASSRHAEPERTPAHLGQNIGQQQPHWNGCHFLLPPTALWISTHLVQSYFWGTPTQLSSSSSSSSRGTGNASQVCQRNWQCHSESSQPKKVQSTTRHLGSRRQSWEHLPSFFPPPRNSS